MNMKNKKLIIIGAGETANLAYEYFTYDSEYEVVAFSVNSSYLIDSRFRGLPVVPFENLEEMFNKDEYYAFVAMAGEKLSLSRSKLYREVKNKGYKIASYISSNAFIWHNVTIGENCFIMENNVLQPFVKIGNNVVIWSGNHIGHQSIVHDNCFITSHCVIAGYCEIKQNTYLGINTSIANNIIIEKDCYIGMNSVIGKNTRAGGFYASNHSKRLAISSYDFLGVDNNELD